MPSNSTVSDDDLFFATHGSVVAAVRLAGTPVDSRTIGGAIGRWAAAGSGSPAFVGIDSHPFTFSQLASSISCFSRQLAQAGLGAEHRVGLLVPPGMPGGQLVV